MIPENKKAAVTQALEAAFGVKEFENIMPLTKGLSSALVFKITVKGMPCLLRIVTRTDAVADPTHYFGCMETAAGAGLAPRIHYLNIPDRISITDFIEEKPFPIPEARQKMAGLLQKLHNLSKFPYRLDYFQAMRDFVAKFRAANIIPEDLTRDLFDIYGRITEVYPLNDRDHFVSCHNDVKPENFVFDGRRPWLVDWEAAFLNDRYLDLAMVGNFVVQNDEDEKEFLEHYWGETVSEYEQARYYLNVQLLHMHYFAFLMLESSGGKPVNTGDLGEQDFRTFHNRIWNGEISLANTQSKLQYAWVHRNQLLHNANSFRFRESMRIISSRPEKI